MTMNANFFWVTVQRPPHGMGENHVQLAYGVGSIGPNAVVAPRLFGASDWKVAIKKVVELAKMLNLPVCLSVPDDAVEPIKGILALVDVKILNKSEE
jgi:hypothetical protein